MDTDADLKRLHSWLYTPLHRMFFFFFARLCDTSRRQRCQSWVVSLLLCHLTTTWNTGHMLLGTHIEIYIYRPTCLESVYPTYLGSFD